MKNLVKNFLIFFIVFLLIAGLFSIYGSGEKKAEVVLTSAHTRKIMDRMKSHRLPDDWDIKCEVMYIRE